VRFRGSPTQGVSHCKSFIAPKDELALLCERPSSHDASNATEQSTRIIFRFPVGTGTAADESFRLMAEPRTTFQVALTNPGAMSPALTSIAGPIRVRGGTRTHNSLAPQLLLWIQGNNRRRSWCC